MKGKRTILLTTHQIMSTQQPSAAWETWQKIAFRFFFLFLSFFTFDYAYWTLGANVGVDLDLEKTLSIFNKQFYWLDSHFYHIGYNPSKNENLPPDYRFGVVLYISVLIFSLLACAIWSWLDRKRPSYDKLHYWFRIYLRYTVAIVMLGYGIVKLIPIQMPYPSALTLLTPIGHQTRFEVLWNFIGASPAYESFTGLCEITGSLLLIFTRTSVFGSLFLGTILMNVAAYNIFYNVPVKIYSSLLLVCILFLLAPLFRRFIKLFFYQQQVSIAMKEHVLQSNTTNRLINAFGALLIGGILISGTVANANHHNKALTHAGEIYDVTSFATKESLPANVTDTLNWKRIVLARLRNDTSDYAIVYNLREEQDWYYYKIDSTKKLFSLHDVSGAVVHTFDFHYDQLPNNHLSFTGKWKGYDVRIDMKPVMDSMPLNREKLKLVQDS